MKYSIGSIKGPDRYSKQDAALLESVREPIAIALSNARSYRELVRVRDLLAEDNRALSADLKRIAGVEVVGADSSGRKAERPSWMQSVNSVQRPRSSCFASCKRSKQNPFDISCMGIIQP